MSDAYKTLSISRRVDKLAMQIKEEYKISSYEALDIALKVERNEYIARAFVLTPNDDVTALEKIVHTLEDLRE